MIFFLFLLKTLIVGEAVLTNTHDLCFGAKNKKNVYPSKFQFYYIKLGCKGVYISWTCYHDAKYYHHAQGKESIETDIK